MTLEEQYELIITDSNERIKFIDGERSYITPSSLEALSESVSSFILNKLEQKEQTPAMLFGSAFHSVILDSAELFDSKYAVLPLQLAELNKNTTAYKTGFAEFKNDVGEREILSPTDYDILLKMKGIFEQSEVYWQWFECENYVNETMFEFIRHEIKCRCRADRVNFRDNAEIIVWDLKTIASGADEKIEKEILDRKYYWKMPFYELALQSHFEESDVQSGLIFIPKQYPYQPKVKFLESEYTEIGIKDIDFLIDRYRRWCDKPTRENLYNESNNYVMPKYWLKPLNEK